MEGKSPVARPLVTLILSMTIPLALCTVSSADIRLPSIVGDNMVLQSGGTLPIWGWADPGEEIQVSVSWHNMDWTVQTGDNGKWIFKMSAPKVGGPYEMTLKGKNTITLKNILVGEVWVCSGQSNMEWPLQAAADGPREVAAADYPNIRLFTVQKKIAYAPETDCVGQWSPCNPRTAPGFSAVGYFFGRYLHKELGVPIGLINTSWGGTVAEAWANADDLKEMREFEVLMDKIAEARANPDASMKKYREEMAAWQKKIEVAGAPGKGHLEAGFDDSSWQEMDVPVLWEQGGLLDFDGLVWFRKTIEVPESWVGKPLTLELGPIDDMDTTWVNGVRVGAHTESGQWQAQRKYSVDSNVIRAGRNVVVVQVLDTGGGGGICGQPEQLQLKRADSTDAAPIPLAGKWRYKVGQSMNALPPLPAAPTWASNPNAPAVLYNGMIAPLIPYAIQGAIWYQGESNAGRAYQYRELFPVMIKSWWTSWDRRDFPFLFVQLANFMATGPEPGESAWAELREAQLMTLDLPNTGMATIIDIGEANDIHPTNKQDVGKRLALWALARTYSQNVVYSGPQYRSMERRGNRIVLHFDHVGGGLVAEGGPALKGFAIAGADRKFVWANANIVGETVVVGSEKVAEPVSVRYAWANNPVCNLYNKAGLPASPFRTDTWPGITAGKK